MATMTQSVPLGVPATKITAKKTQNVFRNNAIFVLMLIFTAVWLIPIIGALVTALRTQGDITANGYWSIPKTLTLSNFGEAWELGQVAIYLKNSFIITLPSLAGMLLLSSMAAFALARYRFRGNMLIYFMFVAGTMLPFQVLLLPVFYLTKALHLYNQYSALIMIHTAFQLGFCTFVLRNFMRTIPGEILEAARMDGAGEFRLYWQRLNLRGCSTIICGRSS